MSLKKHSIISEINFLMTILISLFLLCDTSRFPRNTDVFSYSDYFDEPEYHPNEDEELEMVSGDVGRNLTLRCNISIVPTDDTVMWSKNGKESGLPRHSAILGNGSLYFERLYESDEGYYQCQSDLAIDVISTKIHLKVRTTPPILVNVTVHPSTVLAMIRWYVAGDGGYPISRFGLHFRQIIPPVEDKSWKIPVENEHIPPSKHLVDLYHLTPNTTYAIQVWAVNPVGPGPKTTITFRTLPEQLGVVKLLEMAHTLAHNSNDYEHVRTVWLTALGVTFTALLVISLVLCVLHVKAYQQSRVHNSQPESLELIPNIIVNPSYTIASESVAWDENSNNEILLLINNNSVIHPRRV